MEGQELFNCDVFAVVAHAVYEGHGVAIKSGVQVRLIAETKCAVLCEHVVSPEIKD